MDKLVRSSKKAFHIEVICSRVIFWVKTLATNINLHHLLYFENNCPSNKWDRGRDRKAFHCNEISCI